MKKTMLVLAFLLSISLLSVMLVTMQVQAQTQVTLYAVEKNANSYAFGSSATNAGSPGPALTFTSGEVVTVTLVNAGTMTHNFAIVDTKSNTGNVLWNAQISSADTGVPVGGNESVTFTVGNAGNYFYVCQTDGHFALGMWGNVKVNAAVPEFPSTLVVIFFAVAATALATYLGRLKVKPKITTF
jgi:plastocyanin